MKPSPIYAVVVSVNVDDVIIIRMTNTLASLFYGSVLFLFLPLLPFVDATDVIQKVLLERGWRILTLIEK